MDTISKLVRNSSLQQIVDTINSLIDSINGDINVLNTLTSDCVGEVAAFTASDAAFVTGEVFTIVTSGTYKIATEGVGTSRYAIRDKLTNIVTESQDISDNSESPEYFLSAGDKVLFYASSANSHELTISLIMTGSFFTIVKSLSGQIAELTDQLGEIEESIQETYQQQQELIGKADEILNNHTTQVAGLQQNILDLSARLSILENEV